MRVIIRYENPDERSVSFGWRSETNAAFRYKFRVNDRRVYDMQFQESREVVLSDVVFKPKKNILYFRLAALDEEEELKSARRTNILRGCLFGVMAALLPCAFMSFENTNRPYMRIKFFYTEGSDLILYLRGTQYNAAVEPRQPQAMPDIFADTPAPAVDPDSSQPADTGADAP